ncbi:hypothetical protein P168DRAFT_319505 [Aspergillus campestris IBT 28561]|uniref:Uncharacterized protein n=1 Tax=Aspergillus campestris (strain IBT 28561) TaxID=1392248 RepID=A0A2I1CZA3_ASPC2|nr:uncharacterized protein P168DRAFT_319505 [Aspergillus campestris IBT 28561]PKY02960.1 hypothetical protein P168DRAFT_319505 [Aspergillus campestris IBT 28561]
MEQTNPNSNNHPEPGSICHDSNRNRDTSHDSSTDQSQPSERSLEDLEYYRVFLEQLLSLVCHGDQATVARMVSIIRSGASQQEIFAALSQESGGAGPHDQNKTKQ